MPPILFDIAFIKVIRYAFSEIAEGHNYLHTRLRIFVVCASNALYTYQ